MKDIIEQENKARKKRHPLKKKLQLKFNIMTYGVLALACTTKESAEKLLNEMKENQLKYVRFYCIIILSLHVLLTMLLK